jgi:diadenosine tetraphosphate (Ap4A) HIT family hydrolase
MIHNEILSNRLAFEMNFSNHAQMSVAKECPFCKLPKIRIWMEAAASIAFFDAYPVSEGHSLVIPRIHVPSIFHLSAKDRSDLWRLVEKVRKELAGMFSPDGFNIGVNDGEAAGQTVPHAHIHVIPRHKGDVPDPRGGIRWVISGKAKYW